ncbi:MAG: sulfurtransferase TusA family protein [Myxococcales bacterium]|nr:sulfurtransferase TusA family protein [Myxococcota bacterium]MDW8284419.1 sulfurtransferase TusA family protein [Myxococcales bacterium]
MKAPLLTQPLPRADTAKVIDLDIRGQICPSCLLLTLRTVNQNCAALRKGECEVRVLTDDRQATGTIPEAVAKMGYRAEVVNTPGGYRIRIFHP